MNMRGFGATQRYERMNTTHEVETASPHRLIQLMMERALTKISMARSHMQRDEVMLLKTYESDPEGHGGVSGHSAFTNPDAPADAAPRQSIETRVFAFFE